MCHHLSQNRSKQFFLHHSKYRLTYQKGNCLHRNSVFFRGRSSQLRSVCQNLTLSHEKLRYYHCLDYRSRHRLKHRIMISCYLRSGRYGCRSHLQSRNNQRRNHKSQMVSRCCRSCLYQHQSRGRPLGMERQRIHRLLGCRLLKVLG